MPRRGDNAAWKFTRFRQVLPVWNPFWGAKSGE